MRRMFSTEELVRVLSHYNVSIIQQIKFLPDGSRGTPKIVVVSEHGMKFLLKRHPHSTYFLLMFGRKAEWLKKTAINSQN